MIEQCLGELREGKPHEILERHNDKYISGKGDLVSCLVCWHSVGSVSSLCLKRDLVKVEF